MIHGEKLAKSLHFIALFSFFSFPVFAAPHSRASRASASNGDDPDYQAGVAFYAAGQTYSAIDSFRTALRHQPDNRLARAALRRLEVEIGSAPAVEFGHPTPESSRLDRISRAFDQWVLIDIPRALNFNDTLGDDLSADGTLAAMNGRAAQLLIERKIAAKHDRMFLKDRELRSLVRRMPAVSA